MKKIKQIGKAFLKRANDSRVQLILEAEEKGREERRKGCWMNFFDFDIVTQRIN